MILTLGFKLPKYKLVVLGSPLSKEPSKNSILRILKMNITYLRAFRKGYS